MAEHMQGRAHKQHHMIVTVFHEPSGEVAGVYCDPESEGLTAVGYTLTVALVTDSAEVMHTRHFSLNHYRVHVDSQSDFPKT